MVPDRGSLLRGDNGSRSLYPSSVIGRTGRKRSVRQRIWTHRSRRREPHAGRGTWVGPDSPESIIEQLQADPRGDAMVIVSPAKSVLEVFLDAAKQALSNDNPDERAVTGTTNEEED